MIYGQDPAKTITPYQKQVNIAGEQLAMQDLNLLLSWQQLLNLARVTVAHKGYTFKNGKSQSKQSQEDAPTPKRQKASARFRTKHIGELEEDIKDHTDHLQFKEKMRDQATMARNYKLCDQLTEEMSAIKKKRECEQELCMWSRRQQQADWY